VPAITIYQENMSKKHVVIGGAIASIVGILAISQGVLAYRGDFSQTGPNYSPERHEQMEKTFENNDYNSWKNMMNGKGRVTEVVNEANFGRFSEMHRLVKEGKTDEAEKIREELGLGQGSGEGRGSGSRGQNRGGKFVDANHDGTCDRLQ
jgi:hypothetical protein